MSGLKTCAQGNMDHHMLSISQWLLHGPSALRHTFNHGWLYESNKKITCVNVQNKHFCGQFQQQMVAVPQMLSLVVQYKKLL